MHRIIVSTLSLLLCLTIVGWTAFPQPANAIIPFGGRIITYIPCINGAWLIIGPPRGGSYMYVPGTVSFAWGPPTHPGQLMLGKAGPPIPCFVPCPAGACPIGVGLTILFHGSSAI